MVLHAHKHTHAHTETNQLDPASKLKGQTEVSLRKQLTPNKLNREAFCD